MSKFSVRKPFTVLVGVVIVLVLGFVAFMRMTPDLLPSMNLPYIMVITIWPGSTPEKVESSVTKPLEQTMATLEGIKSVGSTSSENSSMLMLEFQNDVNLDTITVDILQKISSVEESWDDAVTTPIILKMNPDMLPLMATAVEMEGKDTNELSAFARDTLLNKLEGTTGVAAVNASGMIESQVNVVLDEAKIGEANKKLQDAIEQQFEKAKAEMEEQAAAMGGDMGGMGISIPSISLPSVDGEAIQQGVTETSLAIRAEVEALEAQMAELRANRDRLAGIQELVDPLVAGRDAAVQARDALQALWDQHQAIEDEKARYNQYFLDQNMTGPEIDDFKATDFGYLSLMNDETVLDATRQAAGYNDWTALESDLNAAKGQVAFAEAQLALIDQGLAAFGIDHTLLGETLAGLDTSIEGLAQAIPAAYTSLAELEAGAITAGNAASAISGQLNGALSGLTGAAGQMMSASAGALLSSITEMSAAQQEAQFEAQKDAALSAADLNKQLTMERVGQILMAQNFSMPAGYVSADGEDWLVRVGDEFASPEELENLLLVDPGLDGVAPIYLKDVADIYTSDNSGSVYAKINGKNGLLLTFMKQSTYATADVSDNLNARFAELEEEFPGLSFVNLMDQGDYIHIVIDNILNNLILGAVFAIIILFLFLWDLRPTFITLCSIPISVLFAIVLMYFAGVTINIISLSGLAVAVGMLVDNSIVVIENIFRLRNRGESAVRAAISGAAQVSGAIIASTLTTICVFLPIVFVEGITRELFTDMALTLAFSLIASLIVALTLVPAMSAGLLKKAKPHESRVIGGLLRFYSKTFGWAIGHRAIVLVATVGLLVLSVVLVMIRGFAFMPESSSPEIMVTMEASDEATVEDVKEMSDTASERILAMDGVETVGAILTGDGMMGMGTLIGMGDTSSEDSGTVTMYVKMDPEQTGLGGAVSDAINGEALADLDAEFFASGTSGSMSLDSFGGSGLSVNVYGENSDDLLASARQVAAVLEATPGTTNVSDGIGEVEGELRFTVDKNKAMAKGLTVAQVYAEVAKALTTQSNATSITWDDYSYTVRIVNPNDEKLTPAYVRGLQIPYTSFTSGEEGTVPLADIATVEETETARSIERMDQRRYITVTAEVASDHNVTLVTNEAERAMRNETLPATVSYEFTGENSTIMDALRDVGLMLVLGIILIYLIMVAQFQSLKSPFIVMFTLPLAFTGGMLALLFTNNVLSVVALIGFVMLCGIIVNNGIVLIDYINQLRAEGMERRAALLEAGRTRMRPILMTSLTTILGLSTMALGIGDGAELMQPVAIVCIGGLIYATIMTLYIIPILYDLFNRKEPKALDEADLEILED